MIEQIELIKNIPAGKFHSALMTSFSINLYYWEMQLLKNLSGKGINYVSAIVDSDCLSDQLLKFSKAFHGKKPMEFSLHGYKSNGAFHPKIQFYAGNENVLVLIGSGNLTISGHGKNMEVWTPLMINSTDSPAYPFVRDVWNYLTKIYEGLGYEACNIIRTIKENCNLLQDEYTANKAEHRIDSDCIIRLFTDGEKALFQQCEEWIGEERIKAITILSPFYDSRAELVNALYKRFAPESINIIIENGFGSCPKPKNIPDYVNIYRWEDVVPKAMNYQEYYHAKCFFFDGEENHYMLCGSANASVAAFGIPNVSSSNREAGVGYKSASTNYLKESGLRLTEPIPASEIKQDTVQTDHASGNNCTVWIMEASYEYDHYTVKTQNDENIEGAKITFYSGDRSKSKEYAYQANAGEYTQEGDFGKIFNPLYVEITDYEGRLISNRQYVIPSLSMEYNNPSPDSISYRKGCRAIEAGQFVNGQVLRFIEQILKDTETKIKVNSSSPKNNPSGINDEKGRKFASFDEYMEDDGTGITGDYKSRRNETKPISQSTLLFDSIISYISNSVKEKEDEEMDNEEMGDIKAPKEQNTSPRTAHKQQKPKNPDEIRKRCEAALNKYIEQIAPIALNEVKPDVVNMTETLKKFMTAIFFINRILGYRYATEDNPNENNPLLNIAYSVGYRKTATEYAHRIINLFALYISKCEIKEETNKVIKEKVERYKQYVFELCLAVISICDWMNEENTEYSQQVAYTKEATLRNIKDALCAAVTESTVANVNKLLDRDIQELEGFDRFHIEAIINKNVSILSTPIKEYPISNILHTSEFGYISLLPKNDKIAIPCSMIFKLDNAKKIHTTNYLYQTEQKRLLKIRPSS